MTCRKRITEFGLFCVMLVALGLQAGAAERLRLIIETDAGGDPDDEQSLVRFLLYVNEWDIEGIIANRPTARDGENRNPERTGLGIARRLLEAYGECYPNLVKHDPRYPTLDYLWQRTVAGHNETDDAVKLIIAAVDRDDPRPLWYSDWGTDHGAATNNLRRAFDKVLRERGPEGYAKLKSRLRLSSADAFGDHTAKIRPPFPLWVDTFRPELAGKRWYHRFSALTARAGGFDLMRDCLTGHGPLGALYPTNTTHWQKEGDTMTFLYLIPTGMNDPEQPTWGSWAGRYGLNTNFADSAYYWANQMDAWNGTTNRDNTVARWASDLQNDFRARLDWCVKAFGEANHPPLAVLNGRVGRSIVYLEATAGTSLRLSAHGSNDPDSDRLRHEWFVYREAGDYNGNARLDLSSETVAVLHVPADAAGKGIHVVLAIRDHGNPPLAAYRRAVVRARAAGEQSAVTASGFRHHFISRDLPVSDRGTGDYGLTALADLDRDGDLDFVLGGRGVKPERLYWFEFQRPDKWVQHLVGTNYRSDVGLAALDVDRDGWADLICSGVWYRNPGKPREAPFERRVFDSRAGGAHDILAVDADGDSRRDIVMMGDERTELNELRWYSIPRDPAQTWPAHRIGPAIHGAITPAGAGDIDGDGDIDITRADMWFENKDGKGGEWAPRANIPFGRKGPYGYCVRATVLDMDGDGHRDIVMADADIADSRVVILENADGKGGRWEKQELPRSFTYGSLHSLAVADFNNDGLPDVAVNEQEELLPPGRENPRWVMWQNEGAGQFAERIILDARLGGHELVAGDVDDDGDVDLCSKPWSALPWNGAGGRMHVDFLENLLKDQRR